MRENVSTIHHTQSSTAHEHPAMYVLRPALRVQDSEFATATFLHHARTRCTHTTHNHSHKLLMCSITCLSLAQPPPKRTCSRLQHHKHSSRTWDQGMGSASPAQCQQNVHRCALGVQRFQNCQSHFLPSSCCWLRQFNGYDRRRVFEAWHSIMLTPYEHSLTCVGCFQTAYR